MACMTDNPTGSATVNFHLRVAYPSDWTDEMLRAHVAFYSWYHRMRGE